MSRTHPSDRQGRPELAARRPPSLDAAYSRLRVARSDAELRETLDLLRDLLKKDDQGRLTLPPGCDVKEVCRPS